ncbi:MAG: SDR family oxidoreductase [Miltoncostaeaceae bacterium]
MSEVVVTGGTGGLGAGVVRVLVDSGVRPVVTWLVDSERERSEAQFGEAVELRRVDVRDADAVGALVGDLQGGSGLRAFVHLVGGYLDGAPVADMEMAGWDEQMELNLRVAAVVMKSALPALRECEGGRMIVVGSRAALQPFAGAAAYAASKAGLLALVSAAAQEERDHGTTVNAILPSVINTPGNRAAMPEADHQRWVQPEEIGEVVRFLASPAASGVTGAAIPVYGRV